MDDESRYISQKVREARGSQSLRQFSQKCGISHAYLAKIERGISRGSPVHVTIYTLAKLVNAGVEIDYDQLMAASLQKNNKTGDCAPLRAPVQKTNLRLRSE